MGLLGQELPLLLLVRFLVEVLCHDPQLMQVHCARFLSSLHDLIKQLHLFPDVLFDSFLLFGQFLVSAHAGSFLFLFLLLLLFSPDFLFEGFPLYAQFLFLGGAFGLLLGSDLGNQLLLLESDGVLPFSFFAQGILLSLNCCLFLCLLLGCLLFLSHLLEFLLLVVESLIFGRLLVRFDCFGALRNESRVLLLPLTLLFVGSCSMSCLFGFFGPLFLFFTESSIVSSRGRCVLVCGWLWSRLLRFLLLGVFVARLLSEILPLSGRRLFLGLSGLSTFTGGFR